jgi:hypothetical protein
MSGLVDKVERIKDELRDDITDIKIDVAEVKSDVKHIDVKIDKAMQVFEDHVTGDNKIITHIEPILPHLASIAQMAEDHNYKKLQRQRQTDFIKSWKLKLSFFVTITIVIGIVYKFFGRF